MKKTTIALTLSTFITLTQAAQALELVVVNNYDVASSPEIWKKAKSTNFTGFVEGKDGELTLVSQQKPIMGCCPAAPLTPEEEKSDSERLEQLHAEIAAAQEGEQDKGKGKGKKGR